MKKMRAQGGYWLLGFLLVITLTLGFLSQRSKGPQEDARARYDDATPYGGRGLALVLEKLGYRTSKQTAELSSIPNDAGVWLILDPETRFTTKEANSLLAWVEEGHTLIWAVKNKPSGMSLFSQGSDAGGGLKKLLETFDVDFSNDSYDTSRGNVLVDLVALNFDTASIYRTGVSKAQGPAGTFKTGKPHLEIAGNVKGSQLAKIEHGDGQVFLIPDCMLCTNYALSKSDNAVLITNLIRASNAQGTVYFDERQIEEATADSFKPTLLYYLWQPPLRWAWVQLFIAGMLFWLLAGRRLGSAVPLPQRGPVTRASQFAAAMGSLFHKVDRPKAAGRIVGENFRRQLAKRLGMSPNDPDSALAQRAHEIAGLPVDLVDRLLLNSRTPSENEAAALRDAQEMELVLRQLNIR